ncbi:MAG: hypothetical protein V4496_07575, partial [Pseudomonadota bacterium]
GRKLPDLRPIIDAPPVERITVELPEAIERLPCDRCAGTGKTDSYECDCCGEVKKLFCGY